MTSDLLKAADKAYEEYDRKFRAEVDEVAAELTGLVSSGDCNHLRAALKKYHEMAIAFHAGREIQRLALSWMVQYSFLESRYRCTIIAGMFQLGRFGSHCGIAGTGEATSGGLAMVRALVVVLKSQQRQPSLLE